MLMLFADWMSIDRTSKTPYAGIAILHTRIWLLVVSLVWIMCVIIVVSTMRSNYVVTNGNIADTNIADTNIADTTSPTGIRGSKNQTLTYNVDDKTYTQTLATTFSVGPCDVYYQRKDPNSFNVNTNPINVVGVVTTVVSVILVSIFAWHRYLNRNKELANTVGMFLGASDVVGIFRGGDGVKINSPGLVRTR